MSIYIERYEHIDCCRGILAVLVIVLHIWGIFNGFVSSFVVASFFILSGYISNVDKYSLEEFAKKKIRGLLVPYIAVNTGYYVAFWFLKSIRMEIICPVFVEEGTSLIKYWINVLNFPTNSGWFTASWFIWVLFWVVMFDKACKCVFKEKFIWVYWCLLVCLGVVVQYVVINSGCSWFAYGDLIIVGSLFYNLGDILKRFNILKKVYRCASTPQILWRGVLIILSVCYILYIIYPELAVDWPCRRFGNILIHLIYTVILFSIVYIISCRLSELNRGFVFRYIGRISMPVMMLQFFQVFEIAIEIKDKGLMPNMSVATYSRWDWVFYTFLACFVIIELDKICRRSRLYRNCICGCK